MFLLVCHRDPIIVKYGFVWWFCVVVTFSILVWMVCERLKEKYGE